MERLRTREDLWLWLAADLARYDIVSPRSLLLGLARLPQLRWQVRLRVTELICNGGRPWSAVLAPLARWRLQAAAVRLGYTIPVNVVGPGLKLPHWGMLVISGEAVVGAGATLHPGTVIGVRHGKAPVLEDGVHVGPGVKVFGDVVIGRGAVLAANAVVNRSVAPGTTVAGVPARPILPRDS